MQRFKFRLASVLEWRKLTLDREEAELSRLFAELHGFDAAREKLEQALSESERAVMDSPTVEASDLAALEGYRYYITREKERLRRQKVECEQKIERQRQVVLKAERDVRLLEKLKEKRLAEWSEQANKEQEALAGELFLAQWKRK